MAANEHLSPAQFGGDAGFHQHEYGSLDATPHGDPQLWKDQRFTRPGVLSPEHPLHTTQESWDPDRVDALLPLARAGVAWHEKPQVTEIGGKTWVSHGHHRLLADRKAGRPTDVLYGE